MEEIKFKKVRETEKSILTRASIPIAKGVYLSGWLIHDSGKDLKVTPPSVSYINKDSGKKKYRSLIHFNEKELRVNWLNRIQRAYSC